MQPRPTAILAASDRLVIGVMEAAKELHLTVPKDLSVVGFDDIPSLRKKGSVAVASLLDGKGPLRRILPTELIVRESTAPVN
jgi:LacI family transcriptional regulator